MNSPGYLSPKYGQTFRELGEIITLPHSNIQLIKRDITNNLFDLVGVYPLTMCRDWSKLAEDFNFIHETGAVSVVFVADPFETENVQNVLSDWSLCGRLKTQFVVDLHRDWRSERSKNVRNYTRRGLRIQRVEVVESNRSFAAEFWALYENTINRRNVFGIQRLSQGIVADQLEIDGAVLVVARDENAMTGAMLSYDHGLTANAHLIFLSGRAYEAQTSYALIYATLVALEERGCRFVNLGGPAGLNDDPSDGLFQFKSRWANDRRISLLCGEILAPEAYNALLEAMGLTEADFFPAYRSPGGPHEWPGCLNINGGNHYTKTSGDTDVGC